MNIDQLRDTLKIDEGVKYEIYNDHLGYPTFGIGHLVVESDEEHGKPVGETVTQERVQSLFNLDIAITIEDCKRLYPDFDELPEEAQLIIANMCFNLGYPRLSKFKDMKAAVNARDWGAAGAAMIDSRWYTQVPNRARRLVDRMKKLGEEA